MGRDQTTIHVTRRRFVAGVAALIGSVGLTSLLQACGPSAPPAAPPTSAPAAAAPTSAPAAAAPTTAPAAAPPTSAPAVAATAAPVPTTAATIPTPTAAPAVATAETSAGGPVRGGAIASTVGADAKTLDPHVVQTIFEYSMVDHMTPALTREQDATAELKPDLAESWDTPDPTTYVFHLRKGVKFHNGNPLTAEDVKFSFERLLDRDNKLGTSGAFKASLDAVDSTEVVDDATFKVKLKYPNAVFPVGLVGVRIVPRDFDPLKPVGAGPFQFVEWVKNQHVKMQRFDGYWDQGKPYVDELSYNPTPDEPSKITRLLAGQVNFSDTIPFQRIEEVKGNPTLKIFQKDPAFSPAHYYLDFNLRVPPLDKLEVRQALSWAIDRPGIQDITFGFSPPTSSAVPSGHWAFNPNAPSYNAPDINKAKELLAKAGMPNGFKTKMKFITSRGEYTPIAQLMQASWEKIGVQVELIPQQLGVWVEEVYTKLDFELAMDGGLPQWDPHYLFTQTYLGDEQKATNWHNPEFEQLLKDGVATLDQEKRKQIYWRAHEIVQTELPMTVVGHRFIIMAASQEVQDFVAGYRQVSHFENVWIKK